MPVAATLEAMNPLVPGDEEASGIPAALLRWRIANLTDAALKALYESRREALGEEAKKDAEAEAQNDEIVYDSMPVI